MSFNNIDNNIFWKDKPTVLLNKYTEFIPKNDMSYISWYNALTRLSILVIIVIILMFGINRLIVLPCLLIIFIYSDSSIQNKIESEKNENYPYRENNQIGGGEGGNGDNINEPFISNPIDCQKPTLNNPFMNQLPADNQARPPACQDPKSKEVAKDYTDHNLYRDTNDLWNERNNQRQFYTMPVTQSPDDRDQFMKFCYNTPYVCRDGDMNHCLEYEDLRVPGFS